MAEIRWWWQSPVQDEIEETQQNSRIDQAKVIQGMIESAPQTATNLQGLVREHFYLPKDVLVGASLMNLTAQSPEIGTIVERWLDSEKTWWDRVKSVGRGTIRTAFTAFDSVQDEIVKKPVLAYQKYLNQKKYRDSQGILGASLQLLISNDARNELGQVRDILGPSVGRTALQNLSAGKKVNLGEGYFPNSTLAEDTDVYKELVGRGVDQDEAKKIIQTYYGQDITNNERERDESLTIQTRFGTSKLTPAAPLTATVFEPGTKGYDIMSGIIDGAFTLVADPSILVGSYLNKAGKAVRSLSQADVLKSAGIIDNAVRKTIHVPSATEYLTATKGGRKIVEQIALADNFDTVGRLLKNQGDAALHKNLMKANSPQEVTDLLIPAIETAVKFKRLDPNSLALRGSVSSAAGRLVGGEFGEAVGFMGAVRKSQADSALGRIFAEFPVPKLNVKDLNQSFFDFKQWMKWAKVDDDVAEPALQRLAELAENQILNPDEAQSLKNMGDVLDIWNDVLGHIGQKFEAIDLPPQLMKGIKKWMASVDETHRYFVNELGELEWFPGSKFEQIPKMMKEEFSEVLTDDDTVTVIEKVLAKFKGDTTVVTKEIEDIVAQVKEISNDPTAVETRILIDEVVSGFYEGAERNALDIAEEIGVATGGKVSKGYTIPDGTLADPENVFDLSEKYGPYFFEKTKEIADGTVTAFVDTAEGFKFFKGKVTNKVYRYQNTYLRVKGVTSIPMDVFTNPQKATQLEMVLSKTGMTNKELFSLVQTEKRAFKLLDFEVTKGARYDNQSPRMRELNLDDGKAVDELTAQKEYSNLRDEALGGSQEEINALPKKERLQVQNKIQTIEDSKKVMNTIEKAIENLDAQLARVQAQYAPSKVNKDWYRKNYGTDEMEDTEIIIGLNKLKEDALNQVNKEIQRTTRYRSRDFRSGKKGELIDKETVQESVDDVTKVSSGPSLGIVKQNLINDRKRIAQNIAKLDGEISEVVPSFKKANEILESKDVYDPDYWNKDWGSINPKEDLASVVKRNIEESDGTIIFYSGTTSKNLKSIKGYLDNADLGVRGTLKTGAYQGNKPHIVIDLSKTTSKKQIKEMQEFIYRNRVKKLNVVGSSDIDNVQKALQKNIMEDLLYYQSKNQRVTLGKLKTVLEENLEQIRKVPTDESSDEVINAIYEEFTKTTSGRSLKTVNRPRATAHLLSEYWDEGYIPMPDARLFLRVFRPMRDLHLRLTGRSRNITDEAYDKLLSKPITDLAKLEVKGAERNMAESISRLVRKTRVNVKLNTDGDDIAQITDGMVSLIGDGYMQMLWKPSILLRPAWVTRVVGEEQIRMWAEGLDNVFTHPLSSFAWIFGRSPQRNRQLFMTQREKSRDWLTENYGRGGKDILNETMEKSFFHQEAMSQTNNGVMLGMDPRRSRGFITKNKEAAGFYSSWTSELLQLADDPIAPLLAKINIDPVKNPIKYKESVDAIKEDFWTGDLSKWRKAYVGNSTEEGRYLKDLINKNKAYSDSYIDSIVARIHLKTGGKYEAYEILPNGTKRFINTSDPNVLEIKNPIDYVIKNAGDKELIEHISINALDDRAANKVSIFSKKANDYVERNFNRNMTRSEFNSYSTWLKNFKGDLIDNTFKVKASRFDMDGDRVSQYNRVLETLFSTLMGASTNELSRSPAFRQYYWRFIESAYANMDEVARREIMRAAKKSMKSLPKGGSGNKYLKNLENMGFADVSKQIGIDDLEQIDTLAKAYSLKETQSLLYDLNKRHAISDMLRLAFPFAEVYLEIAGTWTRLLKNQKTLFGRKLQRGVEGARKPSIFGEEDDEGFFTTDPQSGEEMYNAPGFGLNNSLDRQLGNPSPENSITNPITGAQDIDAPGVNARIEGYASGLNMVAGSVVPGLGPLVSLPASAVLPSTKGIDQALFPYGRPQYSPLDPSYYVEAALPTWLNRLRSTSGSGSPQLQRAYANRVKEVQRAMFVSGIYDDSTPEAEQKSLEQARKLANNMLKYQAFIAFVAPSPAVVNYEYEVGPDGAAFLDPWEAKANDPQHKFFADTLFSDAYYQMLAGVDGDRVTATAEFIRTFGFDPSALLVSKSKKIQATAYTTEGGYFYKANKEIMDKYPDISYYLFPDSPLGEFDYQQWADAFTEGRRVDLTDVEFKRSIRQAQGSLAYENARRLLLDTNVYASVPMDKKFEQLYLTKLDLQKKFVGYGTTSSVAKSMDIDSKIAQFQALLANESGKTVKMPDGSQVAIENLPSIQGAMKYLIARQNVLQSIRSQFGANASLSRSEAAEARQYLSTLSKQLMMQHPDFYYLWYDIFRLEIEEENLGGVFSG